MPLVKHLGNATVLAIAYVYTHPWVVMTDVTHIVMRDI
jgi:hypothetical protein